MTKPKSIKQRLATELENLLGEKIEPEWIERSYFNKRRMYGHWVPSWFVAIPKPHLPKIFTCLWTMTEIVDHVRHGGKIRILVNTGEDDEIDVLPIARTGNSNS